jgi:hypothetical protein
VMVIIIFHAKAQRPQSAAAFLKAFLCVFAPLREIFLIPFEYRHLRGCANRVVFRANG